MKEINTKELISRIENLNYKRLEFEYEIKPEAYARPRKSRKLEMLGKNNIFYNPKSSYKNKIRKLIKEDIEKMGGFTPVKGEVQLYVYTGIKPPKSISSSKSKLILIKEKILRPLTRPDVDNYAKIILDVLNNLIYVDDSQVTILYSEKYYIDPNIENEKITIIIEYREEKIKIKRG